ncbi:LysR substrate-binding domain-containing protein [uncultured Clostridium sp.]|jgi:DNA-binding transcriptional LysR family regulator|uniref:LysR substrate-binding domain-containing protein n=1 Tax=uncultured Clostridium sp. TaxID=59620 RepID=UPI0026297ECB|nr:LysR substrate-binding domain-containing protein [uncultured Clostridium sp.]
MNFRKLNIFYETANSLNMTVVGKKLYISQPSVSQAIKEMERELGVSLFDRIGKRIHLTYEGEVYLKYVKRILNLYDEVKVTLENTKNNISGRVRVGASTTIGVYILPKIVKHFLTKNANVEISIVIENTTSIEKMIIDNEVDIAFVEGDVKCLELIEENIIKDKLIFIKSKEHIADRDKKLSLIMREEGSGTRTVVESNLRTNQVDYNILMELGSTEAILKVVEVGLGIACVPYICAQKKIESGVLEEVVIEGMDKIKRDFKFVYHQDKFLSNTMKAFIDEVKAYK